MRAERDLDAATGPLARIRAPGTSRAPGAVHGAGFLVGERHVMTCAHVVDEALGRKRSTRAKPTRRIALDLPFLDRPVEDASVVAWFPLREAGALAQHSVSDVAVLELPEPVGSGVDGRDARLSSPPSGTPFVTYGFPEGLDNGTSAEGELLVTDAGGWLQVRDTQGLGYFVQPGFSGAPVFERGTTKLLGMVTAVDQDTTRRLAFVIPTPTLGRAWPLLVRPYKGLARFEPEDAPFFFGRQEKVEELLTKIKRRPFLTVIGASGSGKSSLVLAGLVPRLLKPRPTEEGGWAVAVCRPGNDPLQELAKALVLLGGGGALPSFQLNKEARALAGTLAAEPGQVLGEVATALSAAGKPRLLLVIDQFEEVFTLDEAVRPSATGPLEGAKTPDAATPDAGPPASGPAQAESPSARQARFIAVLDVIGRQQGRDPAIRAVATLRADFTGRALENKTLEVLLTDADVKLGPMTATELTEAIEAPARAFGVSFGSGLVPRIVATMDDAPGALPLMQFALDRLWQKQTAERCLTNKEYDAIRGVEGALAAYAEELYEDLSAEDQARLRRLLTRLVRLATPGEQAEDTRAVASRAEIGGDDWPLVQQLADKRLVTTGRDPATGAETAEVVHEALIRSWPTLRTWLDADRAFGLWRQRLRADVQRWADATGDAKDDALLRGEFVAEAQGRLESHGDGLNERERAFIAASKEKGQREKEREEQRQAERLRMAEENARMLQTSFRRLLGFAGALVFALAGAFYFAWMMNAAANDAEAATELAETEATERAEAEEQAVAAATEAKGRQLAAEANIQLEVYGPEAAERAAALAIEGLRRHPTSTAYQVAATSLRELPFARVEHGNAVAALAFSPDGTQLASGGQSGTVLLSNPATGQEIARIVHGATVWDVAFSPDGTRLVSGGSDGVVLVSDPATGAEVARVEHGATVWDVAFSPDGTQLASGGSGGVVLVSDPATGVEVARVEHGAVVWDVAFSPDGTQLASGGSGGAVLVSDPATGAEVARVAHGSPVEELAFSPDGTLLASGDESGMVLLSDPATGAELARVAHGNEVVRLAFSPDGTLLASGDKGGTVLLSDPATGVEVARVEHGGAVRDVAFSPDGTQLASGGSDGVVLSDPATGAEVARVAHGNDVIELAFSPDGTLLASGGSDGVVLVSDPDTKSEVARVEHGGAVRGVAFSPDGTQLASGGSDGVVLVSDPATGDKIIRTERVSVVRDVAFSPDGTLLASGGFDGVPDHGVVLLSDPATGAEVARVEHGSPVEELAFSPDGTLLASGDESGTVLLSDPATGAEVARVEHGSAVEELAFSPDGTQLASGGQSGMVLLSDPATGAELARVVHGAVVWDVAFSPDGTLLASGDESGTVLLSDPATGAEVARVEHGSAVEELAFSPDGTQLASGGQSGMVLLSDPATGAELARVVHGAVVWDVAFSPNGTLLASGDESGTVLLSDPATGAEVARVAHGSPVEELAFSPDGTLMASGDESGAVLVNETIPDRIIERLCGERSGRNLTLNEWRRYIGEDEAWMPTCERWRTTEQQVP